MPFQINKYRFILLVSIYKGMLIPPQRDMLLISVRNYPKCILGIVQITNSSTVQILYRFDGTGYGTVPVMVLYRFTLSSMQPYFCDALVLY